MQVQEDLLEGEFFMTVVNIFVIENQDKIKIRYRLYKIQGLVPDSEDHDKNTQLLRDRVSRMTKSPCVILREGDTSLIAQPIGYPDLPNKVSLVRANVIIEPTGIEKELDYGKLTASDEPLAVRFLQFYLDGQLGDIVGLWRPSAGQPVFQKDPDPKFRSYEVVMYRGFKMRLVLLPDNRIGVCVDTARKYASKYYLPPKITPAEFNRKYKERNCIYEYGHRWYEIRLEGISGLDVSKEPMPDGTSLYDHLQSRIKGYKPRALFTLPKDCTVLTYQTGLGETRRVASALCRLTFGTKHPEVSEHHWKAIMPPHIGRQEIQFVVQKYLNGWKFQGIPIQLSDKMVEIECGVMDPPELEFGGGKVLSVRGNSSEIRTTLEELGSSKRRLLHSTDAGFFVKKQLDRQYLILPKSMYETFGRKYVEDLKSNFRALYSPDGKVEYDPIIITYNDSAGQSIYTLGNEIIESAVKSISGLFYSGYGMVVIPRINPGRPGKEDELANLVMREFRKRGIYVSIAHTDVPSKSYVLVESGEGQGSWQITNDEKQAKKFKGYLENVVLNKILLLNGCWPFVLARPLNTDLVVGLDVKNNTAGFMLVFKDGKTFSFTTSDSDEKERLSRGHVATKLYKILKAELENEPREIRDITIHRDGILYEGERRGIREALDKLANEGLIREDHSCNFVEIKKSSRVPVRLFDTVTPQGSMQELTQNPRFGTYLILHNVAFLCTTGRPFKYHGTTKPLQVRKVEGSMDIKLIIEDIFALANLTWTKPNYCSRLPITIKMTDIRLREFGAEYDEEKLKFLEEEAEE
jgi:hypothetical protein